MLNKKQGQSLVFIFLLTLAAIGLNAQARSSASSSMIYEKMKKLKVLGSVLYIAAHPDDENTRLIAALSKERHLRVGYLSLTRGDGGQNLIGSELDEALGLIRTNELLKAREIDGGIQYFTTANDFGYSKTAEETFSIWNKDSLLKQVVRVIREFKPDIIITRFDHRTSGKTHGHHTASAILAKEAFEQSNSYLFQKGSLSNYEPHIVKRLYYNTSWWFWGSREKFEQADKSAYHSYDVGQFLPGYGLAATEIAAMSRSMHKSQGFGINSTRGTQIEYFERIDAPKNSGEESILDGMDFSWTRFDGGGNIDQSIDQMIKQFQISDPDKSIPALQEIERQIEQLPSSQWKTIKLKEVQDLIFDCAGIYFATFSSQSKLCPGITLPVQSEFVHNSNQSIHVMQNTISGSSWDTVLNTSVSKNKVLQTTQTIVLNRNLVPGTAFWLLNGRRPDFYSGPDNISSSPLKPKDVVSQLFFKVNEKTYQINAPVYYKNDDPVLGEVSQPLDVLPTVCALPMQKFIFVKPKTKTKFQITIQANTDHQQAQIAFLHSDKIKISPSQLEFTLEKSGDKKTLVFEISAVLEDYKAETIKVLLNNEQMMNYKEIKYPHIPNQHMLTPASFTVKPYSVNTKPKKIAFIPGAGDYTLSALQTMGYDVKLIPAHQLNKDQLKEIQVLIFGIRAMNTNESLRQVKSVIIPFMEQGGKVIFQYNTTADLVTSDFAPSPLKISRDRITDENAKVEFINPSHPIMTTPNQISSKDFDGWVQERGLYFPNSYDSQYTELFQMRDPNENNLKSALITMPVGKGHFIYTGLSFFRQLPEGNIGAYKLFSNLIGF